jgi:hypothetical protein
MKAAADLPAGGAGLFRNLGPELRRGVEALLPLIEKTFPIPARFRRTVPRDVAELSRLLTSGRGGRPLAYLNHPPALSAYLRYFLPWNVYRLCRLLPSLKLPLAPGDRIADLGSGPLTLPIALWLCRPEFRTLPLEFFCLDRSKAVLEAGKKLFAALAGSEIFPPGVSTAWTFTTVSGELGPLLAHGNAGPDKGPALTAVLNVYNEIFQSIPPGDDEGLSRFADAQAALLAARAGRRGRILVVEPGVPRSGRFVALLRDALAVLGFPPDSPCVHNGPCPFPGPEKGQGPPRRNSSGRGRADRAGASAGDMERRTAEKTVSKWCHFAFDTQDAPAALQRLSVAAGLPKDRAVLSFLLAGPAAEEEIRPAGPGFPVRIISDAFPVGQGEWGRYGCAQGGMVLLRGGGGRIKSLSSGVLVEAVSTGGRDPKSGALLCRDEGPEL